MNDLFLKVARKAALSSGFFIKNSVGKVKEILYKGRINIVTDIDKKAEDIVIKDIKRYFPSHAILSEESGPMGTYSGHKWIIDPLDGTTNFLHGFPFFSVSIALEINGIIELGVVYDPMRHELFTAIKGRGARLNGRAIKVSRIRRLSESLLATGFAYGIKSARNKNLTNFRNFLMRALAVRRAGSAALDLCYVACGRFDGYWELNLHPWDSAAGSLIVREASGAVTKFDGSKYCPYDKEILASNIFIHKQMISVLNNKDRAKIKI